MWGLWNSTSDVSLKKISVGLTKNRKKKSLPWNWQHPPKRNKLIINKHEHLLYCFHRKHMQVSRSMFRLAHMQCEAESAWLWTFGLQARLFAAEAVFWMTSLAWSVWCVAVFGLARSVADVWVSNHQHSQLSHIHSGNSHTHRSKYIWKTNT